MKKIIPYTFFFLSPIISLGQENLKTTETKRNSLYIEAFGQGLFNSVSFDRLYNIDKSIKTSFSAGLTIIPTPELLALAAPISYNFIFGRKNHHLELGLGITAMYLRHGKITASESVIGINGQIQSNDFVGHENDFYTYFTPKIGYRFQKQSGGLFLRLTATPLIAGINSIGGLQGGKLIKEEKYTEYFSTYT